MVDNSLHTIALVSRLTSAPVAPLTSREFWALAERAPIDQLTDLTAEDLSAQFGIHAAVVERIPPLLERRRAIALALEELEHKGVWVLTPHSAHYPERLRERLGANAPALLHGVGNKAALDIDGIGIVGSRDIGVNSAHVAAQVAQFATSRDLPVVSGGARGVDMESLRAAVAGEGKAVAVLADSLLRTIAEPSVRHAVIADQLCLVTPYAPTAPFSAGNAMGRNKIIYALSRGTVVVRSDKGSGGTWAGATEALKKNYGHVWSWLGAGAGAGNEALLEHGARPLHTNSDFDDIVEVEPVANLDSAADLSMTLF